MGRAKDIWIEPIRRQMANRFIQMHHYSGKIVQNSQLHLGAFLVGRLHGVMQFGPSMDKRKLRGLVRETPWNGFIELNRMAFDETLPRNSESRALGVALRLIRRRYPQIEWVVSFSDATQCGDGTIYRAAGFVLTGIKRNDQIIEFPDGLRESRLVLTETHRPRRAELARRYGAKLDNSASIRPFFDVGARALPGFQLRYVYFLDPAARDRLSVEPLPYAAIAERGAGMYRGEPRAKQAMADPQSEQRRCDTDPHAP